MRREGYLLASCSVAMQVAFPIDLLYCLTQW